MRSTSGGPRQPRHANDDGQASSMTRGDSMRACRGARPSCCPTNAFCRTTGRIEWLSVHKVIVAVERRDAGKSNKDTAQADTLIEVLAKKRPIELAEAWQEAWGTGARWRDKLEKGRARLGLEAQ